MDVSRLAACISMLLGYTAILVSQARAQEAVDLQTIRDALDAHTAAVTTLEGRFDVRVHQKWTATTPPGAFQDLRQQYAFAANLQEGWTLFDETESFYFERLSKKRFEFRTVTMFDGEHCCKLSYTWNKCPLATEVPLGVPHELSVWNVDKKFVRHDPLTLAGLRIRSFFHENLSTLLRSETARLEGRESIGDADCYRISMNRGGLLYTAWLDPERGFLPRMQQVAHSRKQEGPTAAKWVIQTFEFKQFRDEEQDTRHWFPVSGTVEGFTPTRTMVHNSINEIEVTSLRINTPIERSRFQIDVATLPDGVSITDNSPPMPKITFTGGRQDLWKERARLIEEASRRMDQKMGIDRKPSPPEEEGVARDEAPGVGGQWPIWVVAAAAATVVVFGGRRFIR